VRGFGVIEKKWNKATRKKKRATKKNLGVRIKDQNLVTSRKRGKDKKRGRLLKYRPGTGIRVGKQRWGSYLKERAVNNKRWSKKAANEGRSGGAGKTW